MEKELIAKFIADLPEEAAVVVVAQVRGRPHVFRTDSLSTGPGMQSWPRGTWNGLAEALGLPLEGEGA